MTLDKLLESLRQIESNLRSEGVENLYADNPEDTSRLVSMRSEINLLVQRLTDAQLSKINSKLGELSDDLQQGIENLQSLNATADNAKSILNDLGGVLGLAARVAVLAA